MNISLLHENEDDSMILDKYYKTKLVEDNEIQLNEIELSQKREIWDLSKMETMVSSDETLTNRYNNLAIDGPFKFGYHWNEVIMNLLFNEYVLEDPRYMEKYLNTIAKLKKRRGNPDRKIDNNDFKGFKIKDDNIGDNRPKEKNIKEMEINANNVKKVRDINSDEYELITNSQDVEEYKKFIGTEEANEYDTFFVKFYDNDVEEIWGMHDIVPYLNSNVYLVYPTSEINETTSSAGSNGQYSGPFMFAKNKESMRLGKRPVYVGGQIVESIAYYESILAGLNEDRKTPSMINKDRIGKENEANFKKDIQTNNLSKIVNGFETMNNAVKVKDTKSHADLEAEQLTKMKDFKPVKYERTDEYNKQVEMQRGKGMQDLKYNIEPSEKFVARAKEDMGEDIYKAGQEKIEFEKDIPMYNKDEQPVTSKTEFTKKFTESIDVVGKYRIGRSNKLTNFDLSNVELVESVNEDDYARLFVEGNGNIYDNKANVNESVKKDIENHNYYINIDDLSVVKITKNINENNNINIENFSKLANYSSSNKMKGN